MKPGTRVSLCCIWAFAVLQSAFALDVNSLKPQGYVSDFANVLDADTRAKIEDYCGRVEQSTSVQMALVTVNTLDDQPIEDVANTLYRKWGIGKKGKDEGVLLLLAIQDHKDRVEVGYGLEPILPDGFAGSVLREARPLLQAQQYGPAMLAAAEEIGSRVAKAKGVTLDFSLVPRRREPVGRQRGLPWPIIILGLIVLFSLFSRGRRGGGGGGGFLTGMLLGNVLGGGSRWGGGGFGGYDSGGGGGGGFGGFGGGDSGGGGASSNW
ncbi:MAG: TPM domain-containing protein [Bryobacteraceae bacterium]